VTTDNKHITINQINKCYFNTLKCYTLYYHVMIVSILAIVSNITIYFFSSVLSQFKTKYPKPLTLYRYILNEEKLNNIVYDNQIILN